MSDFAVTINGNKAATIRVGKGFDVEVEAGDEELQTALTTELTGEKEIYSGEEADGGVYDEVELLVPVDDPYALQMTLLGLPMQLTPLYPLNTVIDVDGDWDIFTVGEEKHLAGKHDQKKHGTRSYHGTSRDNVESIRKNGIGLGKRHDVYTTKSYEDAVIYGIFNAFRKVVYEPLGSVGFDEDKSLLNKFLNSRIGIFEVDDSEAAGLKPFIDMSLKFNQDAKKQFGYAANPFFGFPRAHEGYLYGEKDKIVAPEFLSKVDIYKVRDVLSLLRGRKGSPLPDAFKSPKNYINIEKEDLSPGYLGIDLPALRKLMRTIKLKSSISEVAYISLILDDDVEEKHLPGHHDQLTHAGEHTGPRGLTGDEKKWYDNSHAKHFGLSEAGFGFVLDRMSEQIQNEAHLVQLPGEKDARYILNTTGLPSGTKEFAESGTDAPRVLSGRLLEVMSGIFGGALTETLSSGEFPNEAWQYVESIIEPQIDPVMVPMDDNIKVLASWKHLPGKHDQTTHGRKNTSLSTSTEGQDKLIDYDQFLSTLRWIAGVGDRQDRVTPEGIADKNGKEYPQGVEFTDEEQQQLLDVFESDMFINEKAGDCYVNAWELTQAGQAMGLDFKYVEGYADSVGVFPVGHAWVDWNGKQLDITWSEDILNPKRPKTPKALVDRILGNAKKNAYKGYAIPDDYAYKYQARNGTYGPIIYDEGDPNGKHSIIRTGKLPWLEEKK